jgi:lactoylglutathione lyase
MKTSTTPDISPAFTGGRLAHTMLRVGDLEKSLKFYTEILRMSLLRREEYPQGRFTLAFIGYQSEDTSTVIELTYNWDISHYEIGTAYGHIALSVQDINETCKTLEAAGVKILRKPGPMAYLPLGGGEPHVIAFIEDPDGYRIELIETRAH